ncbi:AAA family ATPase [candidate division KSB1 bacterium]|nr:AAA family ATPase [candidate division KSB1 bacterium]
MMKAKHKTRQPISIKKQAGIHDADQQRVRIIAVGGGKGGAGKSLVSVALGLTLSLQKKKVVLIDADLSSPSLHHLFEKNGDSIALANNCKRKTDFPFYRTKFQNLILLSAYAGVLGISDYIDGRHHILIKKLRKINADFIILDLGSGYSKFSVQLFNTADEMLVIVNPEPMSILETFGFIKTCQYQMLRDTYVNHPRLINYIESAYTNYDFNKFRLVRRFVKQQDIENDHSILKPKLILNMLHQDDEKQDILALQIACKELLGVRVEHICNIHYHENIRACIKSRQLDHLIEIPEFENLAQKVLTDSKPSSRNFKLQNHASLKHKDVICSCRCSLWDNCTYQRGGYPCRIKYIGYINTST